MTEKVPSLSPGRGNLTNKRVLKPKLTLYHFYRFRLRKKHYKMVLFPVSHKAKQIYLLTLLRIASLCFAMLRGFFVAMHLQIIQQKLFMKILE